MTAINSAPAGDESDYITAETANSTYSTLFTGENTFFVQTFGVSGRAPISRKGKLMHSKHSRFAPER